MNKKIILFGALLLLSIMLFSFMSSYNKASGISKSDNNSSIISFSIEVEGFDVEYKCRKGMTFEEWCESDFNEGDKIFVSGNGSEFVSYTWYCLGSNVLLDSPGGSVYEIVDVTPNLVIIENKSYTSIVVS